MRSAITAAVLAATAALAGCKDETLTGYGAGGSFALREITGQPPISATITFGEGGAISGQAPCNAYHGTQRAAYPWFELGPVAVTRMACFEMEAEDAFFDALHAMTESEIAGDVLILRGNGREMVWDRITQD